MHTHGNAIICRSSKNAYTWEGWCRLCHFEMERVGILFYFYQKKDEQREVHTLKITSGF